MGMIYKEIEFQLLLNEERDLVECTVSGRSFQILGKEARWCSSWSAHLQSLASCWKGGSYSPMPGGLHCRILTN